MCKILALVAGARTKLRHPFTQFQGSADESDVQEAKNNSSIQQESHRILKVVPSAAIPGESRGSVTREAEEVPTIYQLQGVKILYSDCRTGLLAITYHLSTSS